MLKKLKVGEQVEGRVIELTSFGFELREYFFDEDGKYTYNALSSCLSSEVEFITAYNEALRLKNLAEAFKNYSPEYVSAECCGIRTW